MSTTEGMTSEYVATTLTGNGTVFEAVPLSIPGLVAVIVFYLIILGIGLFASWKSKTLSGASSQDVMLAGRDIGAFVGIFTMTATWVGGGYINGAAEYVANPDYGLVWTQAPIGYAISLWLGGFLFARKMREKGYTTMLDPFDQKYHPVVGSMMYIPALFGEVCWSAAILSALGASLSVILGLDRNISIIVSTAIAIFYTFIGGLYSVAYTDVVQLICIFIGLWLGVGFSMSNELVQNIGVTAFAHNTTEGMTANGWLGTFPTDYWAGMWTDSALLLIFGGIPWQVYFQRVLSSSSARNAQVLSYVAGFMCIFLGLPAVLMGAVAYSADWSQTDWATKYGMEVPIPYGMALPLVFQYLCPTAVSVVGLGAISAAVMSSADSSVLSASTMFAHNVYRPFRNFLGGFCDFDPAKDGEVLWIMRFAIVVVGVVACVMAIVIKSVYGLWFLCADLVYVVLFPQLLLVVHFPKAHIGGAISGWIVGLLFRLTGGEPLLGLPPLILYPWHSVNYADDGVTVASIDQLFPFKTLAMVINLIVTIVVSLLCNCIFGEWDNDKGVEDSHSFTAEKKDEHQDYNNVGYSYEEPDVSDTRL